VCHGKGTGASCVFAWLAVCVTVTSRKLKTSQLLLLGSNSEWTIYVRTHKQSMYVTRRHILLHTKNVWYFNHLLYFFFFYWNLSTFKCVSYIAKKLIIKVIALSINVNYKQYYLNHVFNKRTHYLLRFIRICILSFYMFYKT
jgi:hypothetical protein